MKVLTLSMLALSLLTIGGCGFATGSHQLLPSAGLVPAKTVKSPEDVHLYRGGARPKTGCVRTANIVANGNGYATEADLLLSLQRQAVLVGADAVLVASTIGKTTQQVGTYGGGIMLSETIEFPYLYGVACRTSVIWHGVRFVQGNSTQWIIEYILDESPAQKAGLKEGDRITAINGAFLGDEPEAWDRHVNASAPGAKVSVEVIRDNAKSLKVMIMEAPKPSVQ